MLSKELLRSSLADMFDPASMPREDAVGQWVNRYLPYARMANAGPALVVQISPIVIQTLDFFSSLDASLSATWQTCIWAGLGVTGVTSVVPPLSPSLLSIGSSLIASQDPGLGLQLITEAIHTYTLSIVVTVLSAAGGSPTLIT